MVGIPWLPLLSVAELLMSPVMKEDSCFRTVSFHIRLIRLYIQEKRSERGERRKEVVEVWAQTQRSSINGGEGGIKGRYRNKLREERHDYKRKGK